MTRTISWMAALVLAGASAAIAAPTPATGPTSRPTTQPAAQRATQPTPQNGARPTAAPSAAATPAVKAPNWNDYQLILTRNIFLKNRSDIRLPGESSDYRRNGSGGNSILLTGVILQGKEWVAFFENSSGGPAIRAVAGQTVGNGTVAEISFDSVKYRSGTTTRTVLVGDTLSGAPAVFEPTSQPATAAPSDSSSGGQGGSSDLLERMRQRRLQELK